MKPKLIRYKLIGNSVLEGHYKKGEYVEYKEVEKLIKENFISIKEHEKIVNKIQKGFLETSNHLANQMLNMEKKARKELEKRLGEAGLGFAIEIVREVLK